MSGAWATFDDLKVGDRYSFRRSISADDVALFSRLSGDANPLHMDESFATCTPFGQRVVHGMFSAALISAAHTQLTGPGFVYVGQNLSFRGAVHIGDTLCIEVWIAEKKAVKQVLVCESSVLNQDGVFVVEGRSALKSLGAVFVDARN
jgi:acyl dehydratase